MNKTIGVIGFVGLAILVGTLLMPYVLPFLVGAVVLGAIWLLIRTMRLQREMHPGIAVQSSRVWEYIAKGVWTVVVLFAIFLISVFMGGGR